MDFTQWGSGWGWGWGCAVGHLIQFLGFFLVIYLFIYLRLAVLGLSFCVRASSRCSKRGPLFIAVHGPLTVAASRCGARAPDAQAQ